MGQTVIYLLMVQKFVNPIQKILELQQLHYAATLGNISKDFSVDDIKKVGLNGYVYDFSADYGTTAVDDILDIHKYLMKTNNMI